MFVCCAGGGVGGADEATVVLPQVGQNFTLSPMGEPQLGQNFPGIVFSSC